jgi:hypothetical protein
VSAAAEGESPYFCVFEADFDDAAALRAARASAEGQAVLADALGDQLAEHASLAIRSPCRGR